ncbi:hypothetical protein KO488_03190 [Poseidonibacter lekithochrous]|uniref:hypothetical protein n=1 Tax=Poseidonibacter TaxID=2321187 RepID=UPI001C08F147|nr:MULTISPECIES: hypothetical protein [Poseidonibacter]MBU3013746.1 hypothetical protein [Poseidonibacter lekithochrous]MDO6827043.1 hypothetical protein [Poseidonibacter sp. 1_MG-2023]
MQLLPKDAKKIEIEGSTVDFYTFIQDGTTNYYFDTSEVGPPEPMVNAMAGLQLLDENSKLIMINHKPPMGLFPKIQQNYNYEIQEIEDGKHSVIFTYKNNTKPQTDFSQNTCAG